MADSLDEPESPGESPPVASRGLARTTQRPASSGSCRVADCWPSCAISTSLILSAGHCGFDDRVRRGQRLLRSQRVRSGAAQVLRSVNRHCTGKRRFPTQPGDVANTLGFDPRPTNRGASNAEGVNEFNQAHVVNDISARYRGRVTTVNVLDDVAW